jgi:DNA-binding NtrC family response regulator
VREADRQTESRIAIDLAAGPSLTLLVMGEPGVATYPLPPEGTLLIGRAEQCEVRVADSQLSREHARLNVGAALEIVDLGSSNGTRLDGRLLAAHQPALLGAGSVVTMGSTVIVVRAAESSRPEEDDGAELPPGGALERLRTIAARFAAGTIPVLLQGETGVGKEVLASTIHRMSPRAAGPYVCINCGALPITLVEGALFGHERGAFTGATFAKEGLLESAHGGTVFLDEVAELPLLAQATLLRVLDQGEVLRVGATRPRSIDVRFIAATNRDLEHEVERGRFRQDLYFRLAAATIVIPPLRERRAEIGPLARAFVRRTCREIARPRVPRILADALAALESHAWPGNVRELRNVVERAVLLAGDGEIGPAQLPLARMGGRAQPKEAPPSGRDRRPSVPPSSSGRRSTAPPSGGDRRSSAPPLYVRARLTETLASDPQAARLLAVLDSCDWNQTRAALELGISRRTLVSRLSAYGLTRKRTPSSP